MSSRVRVRRKFSSSWALAFAGVVLIIIPATGLAQTHGKAVPPARIRFTTGAISAQVRGTFTPANERVRYVIKAKKGDHMVVNIIPVTRGLTMAGTVKFPSGQGDGGPGGIILNSDLEETGEFMIEVNQHTMGSNYRTGSFILEIVITPQWLRQ